MLVCPHKLITLLLIENEIELRNGLNLESLSSFAIRVAFHGAENDALVPVCTSLCLIYGLESHAGRTGGRVEVNDHSSVVLNDSLELHQ